MLELTKLLNNLRSLRATAKEMSLAELEESLAKLSGIVAERREEEEAVQRQQEEKQRLIQEHVERLKSDGIELDDLLNQLQEEKPKGKSKRAPRQPKYEWFENGERKTWTGQGRKPGYLQQAVDSGRSLDEFLIQ